MDIRNFIETIVRVDDKATNKIKAIGSASKSLESQFKKVGAALAAAFSVKVLTDFAKGSVEVALSTERVARSIASANLAIGRSDSWVEATQNAKEQVKALTELSNKYGIARDQVFEMRKVLTAPLSDLTDLDINQLVSRVAAAANLLAVPIEQATETIFKGMMGTLGEGEMKFLGRLTSRSYKDINLGGAKEFLRELNKGLDRLDTQMQDYAAQAPEATLNRARNDFEKVKEEIGLTLIPALADFLENMKAPLKDFADAVASPGFRDFVTNIGQGAGGGLSFLNQHKTESGVAGAAVAGAALIPVASIKVILSAVAATALGIGKMTDAMMGGEGPRYINIPASGERPLPPEEAKTSKEIRDLSTLWISGAAYMKAGVPTGPLKDFGDSVTQAEQATQTSFANFSTALDGITQAMATSTDVLFAQSSAYLEQQRRLGENIKQWTDVYFGMKFTDIKDDVKKATSRPIKVEVSLKADMPYQASLSLAGLGNTWNRKVSSRIGGRKIIGHVGE